MSAPAIVTIALAVVAALTVVAFLIAIALVLKGVNSRLGAVIGAVVAIVDKTEPVGPAVISIDRNLAAAREVLESLLKRKLAAAPAPVRSAPAARAAPAPTPVRSEPASRREPAPLRSPEPTPMRSEPATPAEPTPAPTEVEPARTSAHDTPAPTTPASGPRGTPGMPASAAPPVDDGAPAPGMPETARVPDEDDDSEARPGLRRTLRGRLPGGPRQRTARPAPAGTPAPLPTRTQYEPAGTDCGDGASV